MSDASQSGPIVRIIDSGLITATISANNKTFTLNGAGVMLDLVAVPFDVSTNAGLTLTVDGIAAGELLTNASSPDWHYTWRWNLDQITAPHPRKINATFAVGAPAFSPMPFASSISFNLRSTGAGGSAVGARMWLAVYA